MFPALGRLKQVDLCDFEASLVYIARAMCTEKLIGGKKGRRKEKKKVKKLILLLQGG